MWPTFQATYSAFRTQASPLSSSRCGIPADAIAVWRRYKIKLKQLIPAALRLSIDAMPDDARWPASDWVGSNTAPMDQPMAIVTSAWARRRAGRRDRLRCGPAVASKPATTDDRPDGRNSPMEKSLLALATLAAMAVPAWATMPPLGERPPDENRRGLPDMGRGAGQRRGGRVHVGHPRRRHSDRAVAVRRGWPTIASASPSPKS